MRHKPDASYLATDPTGTRHKGTPVASFALLVFLLHSANGKLTNERLAQTQQFSIRVSRVASRNYRTGLSGVQSK